MTRKKLLKRKNLIIIGCLLVVAGVLREFVFAAVNFYHSSINDHYTSNWVTAHMGPDAMPADWKAASWGGGLTYHGLPKDVPVMVRYGSYERGDAGEARPLTIYEWF